MNTYILCTTEGSLICDENLSPVRFESVESGELKPLVVSYTSEDDLAIINLLEELTEESNVGGWITVPFSGGRQQL